MLYWIHSPLLQVSNWRRFSAKPLHDHILVCRQLDSNHADIRQFVFLQGAFEFVVCTILDIILLVISNEYNFYQKYKVVLINISQQSYKVVGCNIYKQNYEVVGCNSYKQNY